MENLQPYIFLFGGIMGTLLSMFWTTNNKNLKKTGLKTEGIIFDFGGDSDSFSNSSAESNIKDKVKIRFVTAKQEWITGYIKQDFAVFFTGQYKTGQKIDIYYDQDNPNNYFVDTGQPELIARIIIGCAGVTFIGVGLFKIIAV